jgi:hypothetical protein
MPKPCSPLQSWRGNHWVSPCEGADMNSLWVVSRRELRQCETPVLQAAESGASSAAYNFPKDTATRPSTEGRGGRTLQLNKAWHGIYPWSCACSPVVPCSHTALWHWGWCERCGQRYGPGFGTFKSSQAVSWRAGSIGKRENAKWKWQFITKQ